MSVLNLYNQINDMVEEIREKKVVEDDVVVLLLERAKRRILRPQQLEILQEKIGKQISTRVLSALRKEFGVENIQYLGDVFFILLGEYRHISLFGKKGLEEVKNLFQTKGVSLNDPSNTEDDGLRRSFLLWKKEEAG